MKRPDGVPEGAAPCHRTAMPGEPDPVLRVINDLTRAGWRAFAIGATVVRDQVTVWAVPPAKRVLS